MIKKAQIKFIIVVMSILFVTFTIVFCSTVLLFKGSMEKTAEKTLKDTKQSFILADNDGMQANGLIVLLSSNRTVVDSFIDSNAFTQEKAMKILKTALSHPYDMGRIDNVFYSIENYKYGYLFVASDMTDIVTEYRVSLLSAFIVLISIYVLLFFVVWAIFHKVFSPIKEAFYKQKQFISNASHELKTPLTIISANADVLSQESNNQWINNIKSQVNRMDDLVTDMLSLAKMDEDQTTIEKQKFNISQVVIGTALPFDAVAFEKGKHLAIDVENDLQYFGDAESVKAVVNILLDNAVKHANLDSEVILSLKKESNKIILSVFNFGSQIPNEHSNKIFERFYRGDNSRSRASGGSGLGLAIAKAISDKNKWKISAVSKLNESMKITIIF